MIKSILFSTLAFVSLLLGTAPIATAQTPTNPAITEWLLNTTNITGRHYLSGNSTPIADNIPANVATAQYSNDYCYIECSGIPSYIIGPYLDGNPAQASDNEWTFKIALNPMENNGALTSTPFGPIGVFINGVPMYDYKDGQSYSLSQAQDVMQGGDGVWNRNAIMAENDGFDCAKGHPSPIFSGGPGSSLEGGTYHHHQNPTAFNLDQVVISNVCDLYLADGLYTINDTQHSPLIGYAFDGFPVYGAYAFSDTTGTGGIRRMESSYQFRNITTRTQYADGSTVTAGPAVSANYPIGWYREDYEFVSGSGDLDEHNGRFCVTPEYPNGIYCYFATVDANWNSAYPYLVGPQYYGIVVTENFNAGPGANSVVINEPVTNYDGSTAVLENPLDNIDVTVFPNPASDLVAVQVSGLLRSDLQIKLFDLSGKLVKETTLNQGSTIWHLDTRTLYNGEYILHVISGENELVERLVIMR